MAFKSDVKAVRTNATGVIFAGRTRLRGFILGNSSSGGQVTLNDSSGAQLVVDVPAGDIASTNLPEDGILFEGGMSVTAISANTTITVFIDK